MEMFRDTWEKHVRLLTEAVDEITTIEDFLAVSENHILEDINLCIQAMVERNPDRMSIDFLFKKEIIVFFVSFSQVLIVQQELFEDDQVV